MVECIGVLRFVGWWRRMIRKEKIELSMTRVEIIMLRNQLTKLIESWSDEE